MADQEQPSTLADQEMQEVERESVPDEPAPPSAAPTEQGSGDGATAGAEPAQNELTAPVEGDADAPADAASAGGESEAAAAVAVKAEEAGVVLPAEEPAAAGGQEEPVQEPNQHAEAAANPPKQEAEQQAAAAAAADPPAAEQAAAETPSDEAVVARLRELLAEVDLATTTEKQLRKRLEGEFGVGLADRKALLRAEINAYLEAQEDEDEEAAAAEEEEEEEEEEESRPRKRKGGAGSALGSFLSPEMQEFLGEERLPRTQVVSRLWDYIKSNNLQDPKDRRNIIFDDKLKKLFPGTKTTMFKLQKLLSKHCKTSDVVGGDDDEEEEEEAGSGEEEEARPAAKRSRQSAGSGAARAKSSGAAGKRKSKGGDEGAEKERKPNGFQKECTLSPELAEWIGKPTASRPEITSFFWAYCKKHSLQDPTNKSFIVADAALKKLTGEERFKGFSFSKFLKPHINPGAGGGKDDE